MYGNGSLKNLKSYVLLLLERAVREDFKTE
nr:hypothetical protein MZNIZDYX_MZNIZDYX_CDS_0015 [uncultured phage]CAI9752120.1 hypothetical protein GCSOEBMH_GCSOEBMH_CDS_0015 [uncultured phage]